MRKWMRERLKRRKKPADQATEPTPAPLQPAYFDADTTIPAKPEPEETSPVAEAPPAREQESGEAEAAPSAENGEGRARRRRRRGRGGRGRGAGRAKPAEGAAGSEGVSAEPASSSPEAPPQAAAAGQPKDVSPAARPPKGTVVLAIGLPGSGKSSWFKRHNVTPLSSDLLRALLFDDATEQRFQDLVFSNLRSLLKARLIARRPMNYVDATNLTPHDRHGWIKLAKDFGYEAQALFFDVPVEVCLQRNQRRARVVEEDVMRRMAGKLKPPTFEEGFSKITVVKVKAKE